MNDNIIKWLSQNYRPEDLEEAFCLSLERWHEDR
jgi:hypothetical protein